MAPTIPIAPAPARTRLAFRQSQPFPLPPHPRPRFTSANRISCALDYGQLTQSHSSSSSSSSSSLQSDIAAGAPLQQLPPAPHTGRRRLAKRREAQNGKQTGEARVPSSWNPLQKLAAAMLDKVEKTVIAAMEEGHAALPATADPAVQLAGNFFPVPEHAAEHELQVEGRLPEGLEGVYVRNGANPMFKPVGGHHLFDGDGMLHAVRFRHGIASYANRFTRTHRLNEEERVGRALFPKAIGELHGHSGVARLLLFYARSLAGLVDGTRGMGVANAGVVFFNGHLLAMSEDDLPYVVKLTDNGDLHTLGRYNFDGQLNCPMIAHPKLDPRTGELLALSYDVLNKPYLRYFKFSPDGTKGPEVTISGVKEPTMMHDFAITRHLVVIPDQQVVFRLPNMLSGGSPLVHDATKVPRFGLLPRNDPDDSRIEWIDVPDCFCFHLWNAWEEDENEVVVIGSCMTPPDSIFNESHQSLRSTLCEIRLHRGTRTSSRRTIATSLNLEAGQVNRHFLATKTKFAYLAITEPWPKVSGIAKVNLLHDNNNHTNQHKDTDHNVIAKFTYPTGCYGGEPMFVPRAASSSTTSHKEDDGYILSFMHNELTGKSELLVLDASSPTLEKVASVKLPSRVPYGFHGTFITSQELEHQKQQIHP